MIGVGPGSEAQHRRAIEREAIAAPIAAAAAEECARLRAMEREMGLGLAMPCGGCSQWVSLAVLRHNPSGCAACAADLEGKHQ